ncbi:hypothetical protein EJ491_13130 [Acinetobacter baumannii]|nr:hypothetical protein EJ491_13130 [Acinetobacter baumannii]
MHRTLLDRSCDEAKSTVSVRVTKQCSLRILPKNQILGIFDSYFRMALLHKAFDGRVFLSC